MSAVFRMICAEWPADLQNLKDSSLERVMGVTHHRISGASAYLTTTFP
jgi:hypothetical protein